MKLYGFGPTRSLRALWGLRELGVDFEFVPVNLRAGEHRRPRIPCAQSRRQSARCSSTVTASSRKSAAIVLYLAEKYPDKGLLPTDLKERAQVYRWVLFAMTELRAAPVAHRQVTFLLPEDRRLPQGVALAREDFAAMARVLERHMDGRQLIVGDRVTVADCRGGLSDGLGQ